MKRIFEDQDSCSPKGAGKSQRSQLSKILLYVIVSNFLSDIIITISVSGDIALVLMFPVTTDSSLLSVNYPTLAFHTKVFNSFGNGISSTS